MLPGDPIGVTRVARLEAAYGAADPRQQALSRALAPLLGKALQGDVMAKLTDGSFIVKVANLPLRMQLPASAQVGAEVPLNLVSVHPRPTFQVGAGAAALLSEAGPPLPDDADLAKAPLGQRAAGAAPLQAGGAASSASAASAASSIAGAPAASAAAAPGMDANPTILSAAGKAISGVLAAARQAENPLTALVGRAPVVAAPGANATAIAAGLQQAVGQSGLFYESHVAEWAQGGRALADLHAEPQQQLAREGVRQLPLDPATAQFIDLQLSTQEQAQLTWQGKLWPGQPMQLEIERDAHGGQDDGDDAAIPWHSRLRLRLPQLGELDARLTLTGERLELQFAAGSEATAALLRQHMASLAEALEASGTALARFDVRLASTAAPDDGHGA
jgi:flagellar hook-length control protein FliK